MPLTEERIDPNPESFETVPFYNFTSEDFTEEQGAMWNSRPYLVKAGEIKFYVVKTGDSLWSISAKNHIKVERLLQLNHMSEDKARRLKPGDKLRIR